MEQNNLDDSSVLLDEPTISDSFKEAFHEYKENFGFLGFVYFPITVLALLGIFIPGIMGLIPMIISWALSAVITPGFISAISKKFYPEISSPYEKLKILYKDGLKYIVPLVWVGIITGLCTIFGGMLFVIPGIWLGVILGYSTYVLIFDGKRGVDAVAHSYIYGKSNFWFIFRRTLTLGIALSLVAAVISAVFPPNQKAISEISEDQSLVVPAEVKSNQFYKVIFGDREPYLNVRQPGDYALTAIFNNMFVIPFAMFFATGIFLMLKKKNGYLVTEEEVVKAKKKIKWFAWLGVILPIVAIVGLFMMFSGSLVSALQQMLP